MEYKVPNFLKRDKDSLLYNGEGEFFFYVPEIYFDGKYAVQHGEYISCIGVLDYSINNKEDKDDSKTYYGKNLKKFNFPAVFITKPYTTTKIKDLKIGKDESTDYRILKYKKNDPIVYSVYIPEIVENAEDIFRLFLITGKIPATIPYGSIWKYYIESLSLTGNSFNVNNATFGLVESEQCRDPNDLSKPYRLSKNTDPYGYKAISIKEIPKHINAYTALTSENWDQCVIAACMNNNDTYHTPLEKVLMQ